MYSIRPLVGLAGVHGKKCALFMLRKFPAVILREPNEMMSRRKFCKQIAITVGMCAIDDIALAARKKVIQDLLLIDGVEKENEAYLTTQILTYLGNKRSLLNHIGKGVLSAKERLGKDKVSFFDAFSGSGIVSRYMKRHCDFIIANDMELYSEVVNKCYLTNKSEINVTELENIYTKWKEETFKHLRSGIISKLYAPEDDKLIKEGERAFYTKRNALILDSARATLDCVCPKKYFNLLLAPLLAEASIHPNTSGVFKGFYKNKEGIGEFGGEGKNALSRICGEIKLQMPVLSNFECKSIVYRGDTNEVVKYIPDVDIAYFDPPYNQHPYGSNYFMLNVLAENKEPKEISKVSGIPKTWNHSKYNVRSSAEETFFELLKNVRAKCLLISYNSEGFIKYDKFMSFLQSIGDVEPVEIEYNTFRGSRNLRERALKVKEYLFLVNKV